MIYYYTQAKKMVLRRENKNMNRILKTGFIDFQNKHL